MKTIRQECAEYILANPGCGVVDMKGRVKAESSNTLCKTLKKMLDANEIVRTGTLKKYGYYPGEKIEDAVNGVALCPVVKKYREKRVALLAADKAAGRNTNILQIKQVWLSHGEYDVAVGDTRYASLWTYADSFV